MDHELLRLVFLQTGDWNSKREGAGNVGWERSILPARVRGHER